MTSKFFIPNLMHYVRAFLKACHICQLSRNYKPPFKTVRDQNKSQLQTHVKVKHGSKDDAKVTKGTPVYHLYHRQGH